MSGAKAVSDSSQNFSQSGIPLNGHKRDHFNQETPPSVAQPSQAMPGVVNNIQPNVSQIQSSQTGPANSLHSHNNQAGLRPPTGSINHSNSVQHNGMWPNHPISTPPNSNNVQSPSLGISGHQSNVTSPTNTNQIHLNNKYSPSPLQNPNPQMVSPQANLLPPSTGHSYMAGKSMEVPSRPAHPSNQTNMVPQPNMNVPRPTNSSIRQRYPNMMPPPMSSTQQPTMQAHLPPLSTTTGPQQNFGQIPPSVYPPTSSPPSSTQLTTPPGFPPAPSANQTVSGRPNNSMPPSMLATSSISQRIGGLSLSQGGEAIDLLQNRHILPARGTKIPSPKPKLQAELWNSYNCSSDIFRCTLTKVLSANDYSFSYIRM